MLDIKTILSGIVLGLATGAVTIGVFILVIGISPPISERQAIRAAYDVAFDRCAEQLEVVEPERLAGCIERARAIANEVRQQI